MTPPPRGRASPLTPRASTAFRAGTAAATMDAMTNEQSPPPLYEDDDDDEYGYGQPAAEPQPQVSSAIAVIRIIAVLGMGLCVSFGLFMTLVGVKGVLIGVPIILLAIPCYYGMQFAERLASRGEKAAGGS